MTYQILGLHHITAIANEAKRNLEFYTKILGLRLVKKTVNFDDPGTYHFYYGNEVGSPGTILTFFPWEGIGKGKNGTGLATHTAFSIDEKAYDFWKMRLEAYNIPFTAELIFKEKCLCFEDYDGLNLRLVVAKNKDTRLGWQQEEISKEMAIKGFHNVTLTLKELGLTARILCGILGYRLSEIEGNTYRFITDTVANANAIDLTVDEHQAQGVNAAGTNHHIAFSVENEEVMTYFQQKIANAGLHITHKIDRDYFYAMYFREPGGVLFEISSTNPGFTVDEPVSTLGEALKLPKQYEAYRDKIENVLPKL